MMPSAKRARTSENVVLKLLVDQTSGPSKLLTELRVSKASFRVRAQVQESRQTKVKSQVTNCQIQSNSVLNNEALAK